ncbi:methyltransferase type 11 [Alicyclobacillus cellulosilyticus]|uniref:Methyltransferase type 11 n=1 Tax=Alicyclobacillus cellulosilyticus TaxID=1003997 RepID=A0A917NIC5_9BACL|nr:methyltransferase type 11 [Alicyclobacillus cellulosilyticus]
MVNPERRNLLPPETILQQLDIVPEHVVADIGCGPGYFSLPLAQLSSTVYGVDVSQEMLDILAQRAAAAGVHHIQLIRAPAEQIPLPDATVDRALCAFVLHEVDDLQQTLAELHRLLKPDGKLMIIEWDTKPMDMGPPLDERMDMEELAKQVQAAGFYTETRRLNPYHYMVLAWK